MALGDVKYEVLAYLDNRKDIEIFKFIRLKGHTDPEERPIVHGVFSWVIRLPK